MRTASLSCFKRPFSKYLLYQLHSLSYRLTDHTIVLGSHPSSNHASRNRLQLCCELRIRNTRCYCWLCLRPKSSTASVVCHEDLHIGLRLPSSRQACWLTAFAWGSFKIGFSSRGIEQYGLGMFNGRIRRKINGGIRFEQWECRLRARLATRIRNRDCSNIRQQSVKA
jgi:hypothetical protein